MVRWRGTEESKDYAQSVIQDTSINQVRALREQTRFQNSAVEYAKNKRVESDVFSRAPALRPQVNPAAGHVKKIFCAMANSGNEI